MSLYHVTIQAAIQQQASFQVYKISYFPGPQVGFPQSFFDSGHPVGTSFSLVDGQANPIMGDALIYSEVSAYRGFDPENAI
jgi:hypothetical protein